MCKGVSVLAARLRQELFERHDLTSHVTARRDQQELHFMHTDPSPTLPVICCGQVEIYSWGNQTKRSKLPRTPWCSIESLEAGKWRWLSPEPVDILADFGLEKGVWFQVLEGIRGMLVVDEHERPHVYMLTKPATHYYQIMTRCARMPVLIDQDI